MQTAWGHHSLTVATRKAMIEALKDPLNQRFQMVCPATVPVRPPLFTYTQLLAHNKSRIQDFDQVGFSYMILLL